MKTCEQDKTERLKQSTIQHSEEALLPINLICFTAICFLVMEKHIAWTRATCKVIWYPTRMNVAKLVSVLTKHTSNNPKSAWRAWAQLQDGAQEHQGYVWGLWSLKHYVPQGGKGSLTQSGFSSHWVEGQVPLSNRELHRRPYTGFTLRGLIHSPSYWGINRVISEKEAKQTHPHVSTKP